MSLFKTKEWWKTVCGVNESFDKHSLLVYPFFGPEKMDIVIVGSHSGYLRMYRPSSEWSEETKSPTDYKSTDLMIETKICECIVDMKIGKFVSGSQDLRLAVLTPSKLVVYNAILTEGTTEHGDQCDLEIAYEHSLPRFPASLTVGPFGGVRGRDFLCVQCLDGTLLFYEQEVYAFSQVLRNRLLPEPIVYLPRNDVFVTASSSWILESYRYQSMAESVRSRDRSESEATVPVTVGALEPDWSYNIGEAVLDIDSVTLSSFEVGIVVLTEKNLSCLKDSCVSLKYAKRLEYKPLCLRAYVIEPDGKLMVLVIADTSTLMIYEGTTLKWSAQLPFPPVAVARAHFQHLQGVIVLLSEDGRLEACYLGSEPALFVAPPLHRRGYDYLAAEKELAELRAFLKRSKSLGDRVNEATADTELTITLNVTPNQELRPRVNEESSRENSEGHQASCRVSIELSSYATLSDVQIYVDACKPLRVTQDFHVLSTLCDRETVQTAVYLEEKEELPCVSSEIRATVTYKTDRGNLRAVQKTTQLPLKMFLRSCPPENTSAFTATIKCNETLLNFSQLFPEFTGDQPHRQNSNALGLQHVLTGRTVTIVCGSTSNRYRVQSNDGLSMVLVVQQLVNRLRERTTGNLVTSVVQNHIELVHSRMEAHFLSRQEIDRITSEIGLLTTQLRNIERRMLRAVRERNVRSLPDTGLPFLLESTYRAIFALLDDLALAKAERERTGHELRCALSLLLILLRLNVNEEKHAILEAAIGFDAHLHHQPDWEEMADVGLTALLRSISRKSGSTETKGLTWNRITSEKDLTKLKKRLVHAVERLDSSRESDIAENEPPDANFAPS